MATGHNGAEERVQGKGAERSQRQRTVRIQCLALPVSRAGHLHRRGWSTQAAAGAYEIPEDAPDSDEDEADEQAMATQDDDDGEAEEVKDGANGTEGTCGDGVPLMLFPFEVHPSRAQADEGLPYADAEAQAKTNAEMLNFFDVADGVAGLNLAQTPSPAEEGVAANGITEVDEELFAREEDDDLEDLDDDDDDEDDDEDEDEDGDEDVTGQSAAAEGAA
eukprot:scaffold1557_cov246-Pinguiococcus_pyrenoidosus.AAC.4